MLIILDISKRRSTFNGVYFFTLCLILFFFFTILVLVETLSTFLMSFKPSMFLYFNGLFRIIKSASTPLRQLFYSPAIIIPFHNRMVQVVIFWKYITSCLFVIFSQIDVYPATFPNIYLMYLREDSV